LRKRVFFDRESPPPPIAETVNLGQGTGDTPFQTEQRQRRRATSFPVPEAELELLVSSTLVANPQIFEANAAALLKDPSFLGLLRRAEAVIESEEGLYAEAVALVRASHEQDKARRRRGSGRSGSRDDDDGDDNSSGVFSDVPLLVFCALAAAYILKLCSNPFKEVILLGGAGLAGAARARASGARDAARRCVEKVLERADLLLSCDVAVILIQRRVKEGRERRVEAQ